jgi:hypothetical protein
MPPPSRRATPKKATPGKADGTDPEVASGDVTAQQPATSGAGQTSGAPRERTTLTLRLPLITVSLARPAGNAPRPVGTSTRPAAPPLRPATSPDPGSGGGQRLLFYAGVAALGVAGVVDWPVAAAIAAGTYIAAHSRSTTQPPAGAPHRDALTGTTPATRATAPVATTSGEGTVTPPP